ncbi:MAG TPA: ATP-binding cassette domain-containing protein [Intrasporangium sp.]|uniref:ATP-binding cassette domain-containing protein n=1 Tax=Intrasporangium sp. TaxID=1925024 RepID=UPI002D766666|nr:ATP-binding cassette domain-containing protein [Intrasporangium sp.]HET7397191.1 ATP-binding cassette domain-containing protein [Intrasporangium sp.]
MLSQLDLSVRPGERVLLAGPSGSGKSTLLRAVAGLLLTVDSGELSGSVTIAGRDPREEPGAVGLVLQDPGSGVVASTLARDVAFGLENRRVPPSRMPPSVSAALAEVGLTMSPESAPSTLSGGELQRLALAGALVLEPRVLLLDEPTAMLDVATAATVRGVVADVVWRRGLTLLVVEHRLDGWLDQVDRLVVLDRDGAILADGPPAMVLDEHRDTLTAHGIWVPGADEPEPLRLDVPAVPRPASAAADSTSAAADPTPVAAARAVTVVHRSRRLGQPSRTTVAVREADLTVRSGEAVALVGPSGAGKSSLLLALGGLVEPAAGTVRLGGGAPRPPHEWSSAALARRVAWIPQRAATTLVARTVRDEVRLTPRALGLDPALADARADRLLEALGLAHLGDADPRQLSGGEQRRLAVAAAVAHGPSLVLADEPTVGQDRLTWAAVMGVLEQARSEGSGVVVATHDPGVLARVDHTLRLAGPDAGDRPSGDVPSPPVNRPVLARVGPLGLLLVALSVLPLPALLGTWRQGLAVLTVEVALGLLGLLAPGPGVPPPGRLRSLLARLAPAGLAVAGVAWSAWLLGGRDVEVASGAALRVLCLVVPSAFVLGFLDPERLGDHLAQRLHLPARPVVAATAALHRLQDLDELWAELMRTRRVRGIRADHGLIARAREAAGVTFGLLLGALGQAATLSLAMDARGFAGARRRTWAGPAPWRPADTLAVLGGAAVIAAAVAAAVLWPA